MSATNPRLCAWATNGERSATALNPGLGDLLSGGPLSAQPRHRRSLWRRSVHNPICRRSLSPAVGRRGGVFGGAGRVRPSPSTALTGNSNHQGRPDRPNYTPGLASNGRWDPQSQPVRATAEYRYQAKCGEAPEILPVPFQHRWKLTHNMRDFRRIRW
jgi:hypothetical protein